MANPALEEKMESLLRGHFDDRRQAFVKAANDWTTSTTSWSELRKSPQIAASALLSKLNQLGSEDEVVVNGILSGLAADNFPFDPLEALREGQSYERSPKQDVSIIFPLGGDIALLSAAATIMPPPFELNEQKRNAVLPLDGPFRTDEASLKRVAEQVDTAYKAVTAYLAGINSASISYRNSCIDSVRDKVARHVNMVMVAPDIDGVMAALGIKKVK